MNQDPVTWASRPCIGEDHGRDAYVTIKAPSSGAFKERGRLSSDSEVGGIVLVLVVVLALDLWDFGAENGARSFGNYFVPSL